MTRKLTLFLVCAFEVALILFVAAGAAIASTNTMKCGVGVYKHTFSSAEKSIKKREYGKWKDWCPTVGNKLTITPESAICETGDYAVNSDGRPVDALAAIDFLVGVYSVKICVRNTDDCHHKDEVQCSKF